MLILTDAGSCGLHNLHNGGFVVAKRRIFCDGYEVVLLMKGNNEPLNLTKEKIMHIYFLKHKERRFLFFSVPSEKIDIKPNNVPYSIFYTKRSCGKYFEQYKADLAKFARDHKITFKDDTSN